MAEWAYDYSEGSAVQRHLGLVFKVKKGTWKKILKHHTPHNLQHYLLNNSNLYSKRMPHEILKPTENFLSF